MAIPDEHKGLQLYHHGDSQRTQRTMKGYNFTIMVIPEEHKGLQLYHHGNS